MEGRQAFAEACACQGGVSLWLQNFAPRAELGVKVEILIILLARPKDVSFPDTS